MEESGLTVYYMKTDLCYWKNAYREKFPKKLPMK
jgi:hypothetical protein